MKFLIPAYVTLRAPTEIDRACCTNPTVMAVYKEVFLPVEGTLMHNCRSSSGRKKVSAFKRRGPRRFWVQSMRPHRPKQGLAWGLSLRKLLKDKGPRPMIHLRIAIPLSRQRPRGGETWRRCLRTVSSTFSHYPETVFGTGPLIPDIGVAVDVKVEAPFTKLIRPP
ncbi:hypothetical protein NE237_024418 [Protea cynaroides]|uniref:Uncharacterized protein n=1 Tax=Protea cynaroides TaxID=273540 RepID=A0A9Q0HIH9_9MAGN|nr:hypothetical protein NE237_024418 [Protea cynaroides]